MDNKIQLLDTYISQLEEAKRYLPTDVEAPGQLTEKNKQYVEEYDKAIGVLDVQMKRMFKPKLAPELSDEDYDLFASFMPESIAMKESSNRNIVQNGGGPGRGYYQYEVADGKGSGASTTALNRLKNTTGFSIEETDFTKLSKRHQTLLLLADKAEAKGTTKQVMKIKNSENIVDAMGNLADFWADFHKIKFKDDQERAKQKGDFIKHLPEETINKLKLFINKER
jgi:hypothetical protein